MSPPIRIEIEIRCSGCSVAAPATAGGAASQSEPSPSAPDWASGAAVDVSIATAERIAAAKAAGEQLVEGLKAAGVRWDGDGLHPVRPPVASASVSDLRREEQRLRDNADRLAAAAADRALLDAARQQRGRAGEIYDSLVFARTERCRCGAGMAYVNPGAALGFVTAPRTWDCAAFLLGLADRRVTHRGTIVDDDGCPVTVERVGVIDPDDPAPDPCETTRCVKPGDAPAGAARRAGFIRGAGGSRIWIGPECLPGHDPRVTGGGER